MTAPGDTAADPDAPLMKLIVKGDLKAFEELVARWQVRLMNFFLRCGVQNDAEDLTQQTFLRIYRYRDRYRATARVSTFLYLIARQVWVDHWRKRQRLARTADAFSAEIEIAAADFESPENPLLLDLPAALDQLSPALREVVERSFLMDQPHQEIADAMNIPVGTVKSRLFNALRSLRAFFDGKRGES